MDSPYRTVYGLTQKIRRPRFIYVENYHKEKTQRLDQTTRNDLNSIKNSGRCIGIWNINFKDGK